eukprot:TRINITY_DN47425_c0_g1_i1.p1 TRINITY_DN47425_c0_g1~~TRINITY_DN47425_c0_g1_i1.p1  ORF type:complete len:324 (+),score=35.01 TRINITY_DN47425_c0_g1_i1:51-1022(+)
MGGSPEEKLTARKYRLSTKLASNSHGCVFRGVDIETGVDVAVKLEAVKSTHLRLFNEVKICKLLEGAPGVPTVHWYGIDGEYFVAVFDLLGPSLQDLFRYCGCKFSLNTVLLLADQMITCVERVHSRGIVHRAIEPGHFAMGLKSKANDVHLLDFGYAKQYQVAGSQKHVLIDKDHPLMLPSCFLSINAHLGLEQSRRDDLESLGYIFVYFLSGYLPWERIQAATKQERIERVLNAKMFTPIHQLCQDLPLEIADLCTYIACLQFDEDPDYEHLKLPLRKLFLREGRLCDSPFDWTVIAAGLDQGDTSEVEEHRSEGVRTDAS